MGRASQCIHISCHVPRLGDVGISTPARRRGERRRNRGVGELELLAQGKRKQFGGGGGASVPGHHRSARVAEKGAQTLRG